MAKPGSKLREVNIFFMLKGEPVMFPVSPETHAFLRQAAFKLKRSLGEIAAKGCRKFGLGVKSIVRYAKAELRKEERRGKRS